MLVSLPICYTAHMAGIGQRGSLSQHAHADRVSCYEAQKQKIRCIGTDFPMQTEQRAKKGKEIGNFRNTYLPTVSESPTTHKCLLGRVIATAQPSSASFRAFRCAPRVMGSKAAYSSYRLISAFRPGTQPHGRHCFAPNSQ